MHQKLTRNGSLTVSSQFFVYVTVFVSFFMVCVIFWNNYSFFFLLMDRIKQLNFNVNGRKKIPKIFLAAQFISVRNSNQFLNYIINIRPRTAYLNSKNNRLALLYFSYSSFYKELNIGPILNVGAYTNAGVLSIQIFISGLPA